MVSPASSYVSYEDFLEAASLLKAALPRCEVFSSDAMTSIQTAKLSTYADIAVVCGAIDARRVERNGRVIGEALLNPTVLVEILSPSTEEYDRGEKFGHYMTVPSLKEYVLVALDQPKIEVFRRPERGHWEHVVARAGERIAIAGQEIAVDDVYRRATP